MKKRMIAVLILSLLVLPAMVCAQQERTPNALKHRRAGDQHRLEQKQENKAFRDTLKGKTPEEKAAAVKAHREVQHQENMSYLKSRLAGNTKLSDAQKTELVDFFESQYQENVSYRDQRHAANVAFFQQIANDASMTPEQKKAAIKAHFADQKSATKAHIEQQRSENKAEREKIRSQVKSVQSGAVAE